MTPRWQPRACCGRCVGQGVECPTRLSRSVTHVLIDKFLAGEPKCNVALVACPFCHGVLQFVSCPTFDQASFNADTPATGQLFCDLSRPCHCPNSDVSSTGPSSVKSTVSVEIGTRSADALCGAMTAATNCLSLPYAEIAEDAARAYQSGPNVQSPKCHELWTQKLGKVQWMAGCEKCTECWECWGCSMQIPVFQSSVNFPKSPEI